MNLNTEMTFSPWACLSFDVACVEYDERLQQEIEATREEPLSPEERKREYVPTQTLAVNDRDTILRMMGLTPDTAGDTAVPRPTVPANTMSAAAAWLQSQTDWPAEALP